jgi:hypothetical protein
MKVLQKLMKKANQARWKVDMCGKAKDQRRMVVATVGGAQQRRCGEWSDGRTFVFTVNWKSKLGLLHPVDCGGRVTQKKATD